MEIKIKIICSVLIAVYYIGYILYERKKDNDEYKIKFLSISLLITYIIYLLLIWKAV